MLGLLTIGNLSGILVILMIVILLAILWRLNREDGVSFDLQDLFIDEKGKASTSRIGVIVALLLSSWAFVHLTLNGMLTEWYAMVYMGSWVLNKGFSKYLENKYQMGSTSTHEEPPRRKNRKSDYDEYPDPEDMRSK